MSKLTPEQAKVLLDSLFALPDKVAKKKPAAKQTKAAPGTPAITPVHRNKHFTPKLSIIEIVHQGCTTCGSEHQYIRTRLIRFEANGKGDLNTAVEVKTVVPDNLPRRVDHTYVETNVCPTCLMFSSAFEDFLAVAEHPVQKELFHG